ncbi:MAG: mechanosensitive ion channel [Bacteroidia bacterium]|nr:mechanosensitive ion channel [Bacteroidia bacterium]NND25311.1 mechanosensitive ion channel [Flavobacteriaceae bacterium]MBT8279611.1 mechanosensitive ion channel [Bacteroidia bacterium]NNK59289.1 mechanosensitive ion channel [Flavobacteriaceae bacterium]NNL34032.1 mechanosensitive ion channel [Flavobacteriaceae bacterium]
MEKIKEILNTQFHYNENIFISVKTIIIVVVAILIIGFLLNVFRKILTRKLPEEDKLKFVSIFSFVKWFIYVLVFLFTLNESGVQLTALFAASAALLIGIGLALQTLFQDIISGIFILMDQSAHVGDIIEIEGKIGRVEEIRLRTTRTLTADNKVLIIPNHLYLTNSLYNWTQNGSATRESVSVGVAYGSDVQLVKKLLLQAARENPKVIKYPEPAVLFTEFADSSLNFRLVFTLEDSFNARFPQSEIRFEIDRLFREHNIKIPFPQREIYVHQENK